MATTIGALVARNYIVLRVSDWSENHRTLCTGVLFGATIAAILAVVAMLR